jgi:hypothetical protein
MNGNNITQTTSILVIISLLTYLILTSTPCLSSQTNDNNLISQNIYKEVIIGMNYKNENDNKPRNNNNWIKYIAYAVAVSGIFVTLYFLFFEQRILGLSLRSNNKKILADIIIPSQYDLDSLIDNNSPEKLLQKALSDGLFTLAVRIRFAWLIQFLDEKGALKFRTDKSNREYIREVKASKFSNEFNHLVMIYEQIWYGNQNISKHEYRTIEEEFDWFMQNIQANES